MIDIKALAATVVATVKEYIDTRLAALPTPEPGPPGADGAKGLDGAAGRDGVDGAPGVVGKDGERGPAGADGAPGAAGKDGERGPAGADGGMGAKGLDGRDGRDGKDGEDGRDALDIDVLPAIDHAKRYRRGTWASHAGGLWVARKQTEGMDGWDCVVDGLSEIQISYDGERGASVDVVRSSGERVAKAFTLPALIYRGLYRDSETYERGDTVTWGGAVWHCNDPTAEKPIEGGKAWTLAVRKGRDGREGPQGPDGKKGLDGRDGRDLTQVGPDGRKWA